MHIQVFHIHLAMTGGDYIYHIPYNKKFCISPHIVFVFSMSLTINSNYFSKRLIFTMDTDCVLFEIEIQVSFILWIKTNLHTHSI